MKYINILLVMIAMVALSAMRGDLSITPLVFTVTEYQNSLAVTDRIAFKVEGDVGSWVQPMFHVYLDPTTPHGEPGEVNAALAEFPWLRREHYSTLPDSQYYLSVSQPDLTMEYDQLRDCILTSTANNDPVSAFSRLQPVQAGPGLDWRYDSGVWWDNTLHSSTACLDAISEWKTLAFYPPDPSTPGNQFSIDKILQEAMQRQAETRPDGLRVYNDNGQIDRWMDILALKIEFQAISLRDNQTIQTPTEGGNPVGLTSLDDDPSIPPRVQSSNPVTIGVVVKPATVTHGGNGLTFRAVQNGQLVIPVEGLIPPLTLTVDYGGTQYVLRNGIASSLHGHAVFRMLPIFTANTTLTLVAIQNATSLSAPITPGLPPIQIEQ